MRVPRLLLLSATCALALLRAEAAAVLTGWDRVSVAPMKTSFYVGSVTLTTGVFERRGSTLATTYDAKVFPWFFWNETGRVTITLSDADLAHLAKGEAAEFTGEAFNQNHKTRTVTGRAQPADATSGKCKVRIKIGNVELIFNGTYRFTGEE